MIPVERLRELSRSGPDRPALTCEGVTLTYAELDARADRVAHGLRDLGVRPGERVSYLGRNRSEFFEVLFGCARHGAVLAPTNFRLVPAEVHALVADTEATVVVVDAEFAASVPAGPRVLVVGATGDQDGQDYAAWRDRHPATDPGLHPGPADEFVQFATSGTTGLPKGVIVRNRNVDRLTQAARRWRVNEHSTVGAVMPLFHMGGSAWGLVAVLLGAHAVLYPEFDPAALPGEIERHRLTHVLVAPSMLQMMLAVPGVADHDYSSLAAILYGSAPVTVPLLRSVLATFDAPLIQLFGMTETTGGIVQLDPEDHREELLASIGRPYPWVELEIRDPDTTRRLDASEVGEVWVRSEQCTDGYWRRPEETAALLPGDGWLRTGDAGYVDAQGFVFLTDRIKDMIITGGENVYPAEVERVLVDHPDVAEVAVVGTPDERWGELVTAVVVPRPGFDAAALQEWARPRLAGFRRPRRVEVREALPRNPQGKVLRRVLRDELRVPVR